MIDLSIFSVQVHGSTSCVNDWTLCGCVAAVLWCTDTVAAVTRWWRDNARHCHVSRVTWPGSLQCWAAYCTVRGPGESHWRYNWLERCLVGECHDNVFYGFYSSPRWLIPVWGRYLVYLTTARFCVPRSGDNDIGILVQEEQVGAIIYFWA